MAKQPDALQLAELATQVEKIKQLTDEKESLEEEKRHLDEELKAQSEQIYKLNERLFFKDFDQEMKKEEKEMVAVQRLQDIKDSSVQRQADIIKLRSRLQNLKSDV